MLEGFQNLWEGIPLLRGELIILGLLGYYLLAWALVGRDPRKASSVPMFEPPEGYSPAALRYLWASPTGFDAGCFTALMVGLAEKGVLRIERKGSTFHLHDLGLGKAELLEDEECVYKALFPEEHIDPDLPQKSFSLGGTGRNAARKVCRAAWDGLKGKLHKQFKKGYRVNNRRWVTLGIWIYLLGGGFLTVDPAVSNILTAGGFRTFDPGVSNILTAGNVVDIRVILSLMLGFGLAFFCAMVLFFCHGGITMLRSGEMVPGFGLGVIGLGLGFVYVNLAMDVHTLSGFFRVVAWMIFGYILNACFLTLMKCYSRKGRQVTDHIEGLRMYMNGHDGKHTKLAYAPQLSMEHHDQLLPYAVALGCTEKWAERFDTVSPTSIPGELNQKRVSGGFIGMPEGAQMASVLAVGGDFHRALMTSCGLQT